MEFVTVDVHVMEWSHPCPFEHHPEIEKKMLLRGWHLPEKATPFLSSLPSNESQPSKNSKVRTKDLKPGCFGGGGAQQAQARIP
jgi:hypothetical protein